MPIKSSPHNASKFSSRTIPAVLARAVWVPVMLVLLVLAIPVQADLIQKTITIDGNFGDWAEILANPDQTSDDEEGDTIADGDFPVQSTGRDLNTFAYTWDDDNLYFYVSRYGSSNNTNWWWFYLDLNANGLMETGEKCIRSSGAGVPEKRKQISTITRRVPLAATL